jgi:hypothetical protein
MSTPWDVAKEILTVMLLANEIPEAMPPREVYLLRPQFGTVVYKNFRTNLCALRKTLKQHGVRAQEDHVALIHDQRLYPTLPTIQLGAPRWNGSSAERLLKIDIDDGKNERNTPRELWLTRDEYKIFQLTTFRQHIHQETRSRIETSYWLARKKNSQQPEGQNQA